MVTYQQFKQQEAQRTSVKTKQTQPSISKPTLKPNEVQINPQTAKRVEGVIVIEKDPRYHVHGIDLIYPIRINAVDAMLGTAADVPSLEGRIFNINIPAGTNTGTKLRIPNQGLYAMEQHGSIRGGLIVDVEVVVPRAATQEQIDLLKKLKSII